MKDELRVLNALIGMTNGAGNWPTPLKTYGFRLTALQRDVGVTVDGKPGIVTPEAVFQSLTEDGCLVVESKSASLDDTQAKKYWALSSSDLVSFAACHEPDNLSTHVVAPIYFCSALHTATLGPTLDDFNQRSGADIPLVDYDNHRFQLCGGTVRLSILQILFDGGLYFSEQNWPTRFVPFDADSPVEELVGPVMQEVAALLLNPDIHSFTAVDVARGHPDTNSDGCVPFYEMLGTTARKRYRVRIASMVEQFRGAYLPKDLIREKPGPAWKQEREVDSQRYTGALLAKIKDFTIRIQDGRSLPRQKQVERLIGQEQLEELVSEPE